MLKFYKLIGSKEQEISKDDIQCLTDFDFWRVLSYVTRNSSFHRGKTRISKNEYKKQFQVNENIEHLTKELNK